jgi:isopentenyl-diphosphate delta-isomerase
MREEVILVDDKDRQVGAGEKLDTHRKGILHRGFSIFIFNSKGEMMLQKRAMMKYHGAGLWSNACCGHPRPGEDLMSAMKRRLREEMGFECKLERMFDFIYKVQLDKGMMEHEFLHVYKGIFDGVPKVNPDEADDWKWVSMDDLRKDMGENPDSYSAWFKLSMEKLDSSGACKASD